jgi:solute:Na+ symporter, SSS family
MNLHSIDIAIILLYLISTIFIGWWVSKRASKDINAYFLGGNSLPWYFLGISNASGMFDIAGTMLLVYWLFVYGMKSMWIPWLWPVFNQIFLMVYLSIWLRRSNVMTGAEWIRTRFGDNKGSQLSHIIVVIFAIVSVIGFLAYGFKGIGKFANSFLPQIVTNIEFIKDHPQINANLWALILMAITTFYVVKGGMFSVVITEVIQYGILTIVSISIGIIALCSVSPETLSAVIPHGWTNMFFGKTVGLDWSKHIPALNEWILKDGYSLFSIFFGMMVFKGIFLSAAGPAPNYDMQRILSTKSPKEAAKMSSLVSIVLNPARYFMIAGLTVLALVNFSELIKSQPAGVKYDFESLLPIVLAKFVPIGLVGFMIAGLLAAFMSNFAATVNAAPAYIVNDIYKRYINPNADSKIYVRYSYIASLGIVVVGIAFGFVVESISEIMMWIVAALWGGYVASNVLKWYWWRFNGYGYFWGMVAGIVAAVLTPVLVKFDAFSFIKDWPIPYSQDMNAFPIIFIVSLIGCLLGTLLTKPQDNETLLKFYKTVRPWGFWGPIQKLAIAENPDFKKNTNFWRDMINILVGIFWQISLMAFPVFFVIGEYKAGIISVLVIAATGIFLKFNWWNKLED